MHTIGTGAVNFITGHRYNHWFGYNVPQPTVITIDNFKIDNKNLPIHVYSTSFAQELTSGLNLNLDENGYTADGRHISRSTPPQKIIIKNNTDGFNFVLPDKTLYPFFEKTEYIKDE